LGQKKSKLLNYQYTIKNKIYKNSVE